MIKWNVKQAYSEMECWSVFEIKWIITWLQKIEKLKAYLHT